MKKETKTRILLDLLIAAVLTLVLGKIFLRPHILGIYLAKSQDGIQFSQLVGPVVKNRSVPAGGYFNDGWIRLYADDGIYMRFIRLLKTRDNHFVRGLVAMKSKDGLRFQKEKITLDTFPFNFAMMTDPYLIKTKEGFWRLYIVVWEKQNGDITKPLHSLISDNGINWRYEGKVTDYRCTDPTVLYVEEKDHYILYCLEERNKVKAAFSRDGKRFAKLQDYGLPAIQEVIKTEKGYLLYYEIPEESMAAKGGVAISRDGIQIEERVKLDVPLNAPVVIKHPDGFYYLYSNLISADI